MDPIDEYYYELNPIEKELMYKYRCLKCGYEEWAPAFVVDEIGYMDEVLQDDSECKKRECLFWYALVVMQIFILLVTVKSNRVAIATLLRVPVRGFF